MIGTPDMIVPAASGAHGAPSSRRLIALHGTIIALCIVLGAALSFTRGQDINFDQLNYHTYSAYAYETNRLDQDVAPSQVMHNYFNPVVYLPFYFMVRHLSPSLVGMGLGALHGLNIWLIFVIARIVTRALPPATRLIAIIAAVAMSAASPMAVSEFGTTMADLLVSLPILAGLALLLHADFAARPWVRTAASICLSGLLLGAAVSLKLTSASYAIGLAAAALVGWRGWGHRVTAFVATGVGGAIGFATIGGYWYLLMWQKFHNPVFPYFNTVFRSPDYPSQTSLFDVHYIPHSIGQALSYPFLWTHTQTATTEIPFRDVRFALLIVLFLGVAALRLALRGRLAGTMPAAGRRLIVFFVIAFGVWVYEWSIQRYIVSLELLAGPVVVVLLQWSGLPDLMRGRAIAAASAAIAVLCLVTVKVPDWGHLGWRKTWYVVDAPATPGPPPLYFLDGEPLSFVVPELPPQSAAIEVIAWENLPSWGDTVFLRRIHALLADQPQRPVWAVASGELRDGFKATVAQYGLKPEGACQTTKGRPFPLTWCPLVRITPPA